MRSTFFGLAFLASHLAPIFFFFFAPDRPGPKALNLSGEYSWGTVVHKGERLTIDGHPRWIATGLIRGDGKLAVQWIENDTGRTAPALYTIEGEKITGFWGWTGSVEWLENGDLVGALMADAIVRK